MCCQFYSSFRISLCQWWFFCFCYKFSLSPTVKEIQTKISKFEDHVLKHATDFIPNLDKPWSFIFWHLPVSPLASNYESLSMFCAVLSKSGIFCLYILFWSLLPVWPDMFWDVQFLQWWKRMHLPFCDGSDQLTVMHPHTHTLRFSPSLTYSLPVSPWQTHTHYTQEKGNTVKKCLFTTQSVIHRAVISRRKKKKKIIHSTNTQHCISPIPPQNNNNNNNNLHHLVHLLKWLTKPWSI